MTTCVKHVMLKSHSHCGQCGHEYCDECLVYPFGESRPPMCIGCALSFAGVRAAKISPRREPRTTFAERRRRKNAPLLPEVVIPPPSLDVDHPIELPAWGR